MGTRHTVVLSSSAPRGGTPLDVERHTIIPLGGKRAYDFYLVARNVDALAQN